MTRAHLPLTKIEFDRKWTIAIKWGIIRFELAVKSIMWGLGDFVTRCAPHEVLRRKAFRELLYAGF